MIVVGTVTAGLPVPVRSRPCCRAKLGNKKAFAFDVSAACAGSIYALSVADRFVASGAVKNALVVGADALTRITDWTDRNTCILFGDGAGAMVLKPTDDPRRGILHDAPARRRLATSRSCSSRAAARRTRSRRRSSRSGRTS